MDKIYLKLIESFALQKKKKSALKNNLKIKKFSIHF